MRIVTACLLVVFAAPVAMASVFTMVPAITTINPGESIEIDMYVSSVDAGVRAYSGWVDIVGGDSGQVSCVYLDSQVDTARTDWVFADVTGATSEGWSDTDCLFFGVSDEGSVVTEPRYMATMIVEASPDAYGTFQLEFLDVNGTLTNVTGAGHVQYPITSVVETTITVTPSADDCADAVVAEVGANNGSNRLAGADLEEASCQSNADHDIWFVYTATCDGQVRLTTDGSDLLPWDDSVLSVYDACGGMELACDDDSGTGLHAALSFDALAGVEYWIRAAGFDVCTGTIVLNVFPASDCTIGGSCFAEGERNPANECEACIPALSATAWSQLPAGTFCGSDNVDACDNADACNDLGVCETNHKPDGTSCPDDGNECSDDYCEGGVCAHPFVVPGTPCGSDIETECNNADTCDEFGVCQDNFEPVDTPCGDPYDSECDNPDSCDGAGFCVSNHEVDGLACSDDGNACTDDICASGTCDHPNQPEGYACGDQTTDTQCDHLDACDGLGVCLDHIEEDGTPCDDGDACTTGEESCQAGVCLGTLTLEAPTVLQRGCRVIEVSPQPAGDLASVALVVTSPEWPCLQRYVGADGVLTDTAFEQPIADWGTVFVVGQDIVPDTEYAVHAVCDAYTTESASATTMVWGDTDGNSTVNLTDILCLLDTFAHVATTCTPEAADMAPCTPNRVVNLDDITDVLDAFRPIPYPCPDPCS